MALSSDGKRVLGGFDNGTVRIWDAGRGTVILTLTFLPPVGGSRSDRDWVAIGPDGSYAASPNGERAIRWRVGGMLRKPSEMRARYNRPELLKQLFGEPASAPPSHLAGRVP